MGNSNQSFRELLSRFRSWNGAWNDYAENPRNKPLSADDFIKSLSKEFEVTKKEVKAEFKSGDWIRLKSRLPDVLACVTDFKNAKAYGFSHTKEWVTDDKNMGWSFKASPNDWKLATEEEVKSALKMECLKKYLNASAKCLHLSGVTSINEGSKFEYIEKWNMLKVNGRAVFDCGKWATITPSPKEMTISDIEKELGYPIKVKEL